MAVDIIKLTVYQFFLALEQPQANLDYLQELQRKFPQTNVQFFFERIFEQ